MLLVVMMVVVYVMVDNEVLRVVFSDFEKFMSVVFFLFLLVVLIVLVFGLGVFLFDCVFIKKMEMR